MTYLVFPALLFFIVAPGPERSIKTVRSPTFARFSFFYTTLAIVDQEGTVREGIVTEATAEEVKVRFDSGVKSFSRASVASAESLRDGRIDGVIKGALFGFVVGALASQGCESAERCHTWALGLVTGGVGYLLEMPRRRFIASRSTGPRRSGQPGSPNLRCRYRFASDASVRGFDETHS